MPRYDFRMQRLYTEGPLVAGLRFSADRAKANYLLNVLRMQGGDELLLFNGKDGEWRAHIEPTGRKACDIIIDEQTRAQSPAPDLLYLFAPIKAARLDYMAQKAVEMGAGRLQPILTQHTQLTGNLKLDKVRANALEACEQCGVLHIPQVDEPDTLKNMVSSWQEKQPGRTLIFCDEGDAGQNPLDALKGLERGVPLAILIGPEGGFSQEERALLLSQDFVRPIPLGPRVLRADTAAVAAMAIVQAKLGDWI
ncbi:16S rRNA (uracil(1498)-N(3))-methyltransferase [Polycladidibacter hongkongensis]|uniref:16S rRNA (uracil(1498)-N(3))-methyltransferase n=1 Tax=Polycladidibacter hongkongensis TaxID=1647556 RepID=UPI00082F0E1D|nr:16S rRNA (uracil(1498)-N(3))-methyltransferase [Pseudovibrio hongkongensis]